MTADLTDLTDLTDCADTLAGGKLTTRVIAMLAAPINVDWQLQTVRLPLSFSERGPGGEAPVT